MKATPIGFYSFPYVQTRSASHLRSDFSHKWWPNYYICKYVNTERIICRILIVDDDDDLCSVMKAIQIDPMILFLDNNLPDGIGLDHIHSIKAICPHVAIVLMTAGTAPNLKHLALSIGASQFISKPFSTKLLFEIVNTLCPGLHTRDA